MKNRLTILILFFTVSTFYAQEDLLSEFDSVPSDTFKSAAFKGLKIVNFESTKMVSKGELYFVTSHRFGSVNTGIKDFLV